MADPRIEYARLAARSRLLADELARGTIRQLYDEMAALLMRLVETGTGETLSAARAAALALSVRRLMDDLTDAMAGRIGTSAARATTLGARAHSAAVRAVGAPATSFTDVPRRAVEALMARREIADVYGVDSYADFFKVVTDRAVEGLGDEVDRLLTSQVARGVSVDRATTEIAALIARDDRDLLDAVQRIGARGGLRRGLRQTLEETAAALPSEARLDQARALMGKARRLAATEITTAHREGDRLAAERSPVVSGVRFRLSGNHPVADVCDLLATQNLYGLGPGVYPAESAPTTPHPHCRCYFDFVLRPPEEWGTPLPDAPAPLDIDEAEARRVLGEQGEGKLQREIAAARARVTMAHREQGVRRGAAHVEARRTEYERLRASADVRPNAGLFDPKTGGYVTVHEGHQPGAIRDELRTARFYAERGQRVQLLDERGAGRTPDARHFDEPGQPVYDYKTIAPGGNLRGQVQRALRDGRKQARGVVVRLDFLPDADAVERGVSSAIRLDRARAKETNTQPLLERIVFLYLHDGSYHEERFDARPSRPGPTLSRLRRLQGDR